MRVFFSTKLRLFACFAALACIIGACTEFDRVVKSHDYNFKYKKALEYYEKGQYIHSIPLIEELIPIFKGTEKSEILHYYFAYSYYNDGDYALAAHYFKVFTRLFPVSKHTEECFFLNAYCYYLNSPNYTLDQEDTKNAISEMQNFANVYPESPLLDSCNRIIDQLRVKLEKKSYAVLKQYYFIDDWKASINEAQNFLKDYPASDKNEEVSFLIVKSYYLLGINSIETKKKERLEKAMEHYLKFVNLYPKSDFGKEAEKIYAECSKQIQKLNI